MTIATTTEGAEEVSELTLKETRRLEALNQAVVARRDDDNPQRIVERAEAFYAFLRGGEEQPK